MSLTLAKIQAIQDSTKDADKQLLGHKVVSVDEVVK